MIETVVLWWQFAIQAFSLSVVLLLLVSVCVALRMTKNERTSAAIQQELKEQALWMKTENALAKIKEDLRDLDFTGD